MKKLIILVIALCSMPALAQPLAATFTEAKELGFDPVKLDSLYPSAAHADPQKGVFKDKQGEFLKSYRQLHQDLANFLAKEGFSWPERTRLFTRVYFAPGGTIDFFLINPKQADLSKEQSDELFEHLNSFIADYNIPMKADSKFAQCSPVTYVSPKKDQ